MLPGGMVGILMEDRQVHGGFPHRAMMFLMSDAFDPTKTTLGWLNLQLCRLAGCTPSALSLAMLSDLHPS